jgi:radical SAM protein with 4Fe4S-binding SPASM domain
MQYDVTIVIITNGIRLADKNFCTSLRNLNYEKLRLGISIKGTSEEEYLDDCGYSGYKSLLNGIKNCDELGISYRLSYLLTRKKIQNIEVFLKNIKANDMVKKPIAFSFCMPVISKTFTPIDSKESLIEMDLLFAQKYKHICDSLDTDFQLQQIFPLCMCEKSVLKEMETMNRINNYCHVHNRDGIIFNTQGSLLMCNNLTGYSLGKFGVDYNDVASFKKYWISDYLVDLHKKFTAMPSLECRSCNAASICGGGCCLQWLTQFYDGYRTYLSALKGDGCHDN